MPNLLKLVDIKCNTNERVFFLIRGVEWPWLRIWVEIIYNVVRNQQVQCVKLCEDKQRCFSNTVSFCHHFTPTFTTRTFPIPFRPTGRCYIWSSRCYFNLIHPDAAKQKNKKKNSINIGTALCHSHIVTTAQIGVTWPISRPKCLKTFKLPVIHFLQKHRLFCYENILNKNYH